MSRCVCQRRVWSSLAALQYSVTPELRLGWIPNANVFHVKTASQGGTGETVRRGSQECVSARVIYDITTDPTSLIML